MTYKVGGFVGEYEVIEVLGAGGMGEVYKVRHSLTRRVEAMKVIVADLRQDPLVANRFHREIRLHARLKHPNIAYLQNATWIGNQLVLIMEFVDGTSIAEILQRRSLPFDEAVHYSSQALSALGCAHSLGIVHRDIKPANLMVTSERVLKVMDFGIAKGLAETSLTRDGGFVGSPHYTSPEQVTASPRLDARSDLYSLGVSLYEMVTGRRPFEGTALEIVRGHLYLEPQPPVKLNPEVPLRLNEAILTALRKNPDQRFRSAEEFRMALDAITVPQLDESSLTSRRTTSRPSSKLSVEAASEETTATGIFVRPGPVVSDSRSAAQREQIAKNGSEYQRWQERKRRIRIILKSASAVVVALATGLYLSTLGEKSAAPPAQDVRVTQASPSGTTPPPRATTAPDSSPTETEVGQRSKKQEKSNQAVSATALKVSGPTGPSAAAPVRVELDASQPVWVAATSDGEVKFQNILQPQQTRVVTAQNVVRLRVGDAGALAVKLNGQEQPPVGPRGQVRTVILTPKGMQVLTPEGEGEQPNQAAPARPSEGQNP